MQWPEMKRAIKEFNTATRHLCMRICMPITVGMMFTFATQALACKPIKGSPQPGLIFPPKYHSLQPEEDYVFQLLELVLKKSESKYGPCEVKLLDNDLPLKRMELYLQKNENIHAISLTVNRQRDQLFRPVKIPIAKGMMGLRIFIIREGEQARFDKVNNLNDLQAFTAGQGEDWTDTDIFVKNGLPILTGGNIPTLVDMLTHKRFDYFPRGALQLVPELKIFKNIPIEPEKKIVLSYPLMNALYVNRNNIELANRLEYGLKRAYEDGSFEKFFYSHPTTIEALKALNLKSRTIIEMCNPFMPNWVPVSEAKYWLIPWSTAVQKGHCEKIQRTR